MNLGLIIRYSWNKIFWFFGKPIRSVYSFIVRPHKQAAKVLIIHSGKILLVKPNYGKRQWNVPGGGIVKGEPPEDGARRELVEELSVSIEKIHPIGTYLHEVGYAKINNFIFVAELTDLHFSVDRIEIAEAQWFSLDSLPMDRISRLDTYLKMYQTSRESLP